MVMNKSFSKQRHKPKNPMILKRRSSPIYILLAAALLIGSVCVVILLPSLATQPIFAKPQVVVSAQTTSQQTASKSQFDVHVAYAYVGPRKDHFTCQNPLQDKIPIATLNAVSLYPSIVYFNFTHVSSAETESCDAKMEVYLIQLTANTGATENYTYTEATNYNPTFSDLDTLSSHVNDFAEARSTNGLGGCFVFNWTANTSNLVGRIGSYGSYTSNPSGLGLWSAGEPNTITVSVRRIGLITMKGTAVSTSLVANSESTVQVQLEKFGDGFLYNNIVSQDKLSQIDLYNPPIPDS